jgi:SAM-dependent methyltransferase
MGEAGNAAISAFLKTWTHESQDPFLERYGSLDDAGWEEKVVRSIEAPEQDGIAFPRFPPRSLQERVHGHFGEAAVREIFSFYRVVAAFAGKLGFPLEHKTRLLDFGTGWGRTITPFMARIQLKNIFGFEPNPLFCQVARALNPYVAFVSGDFAPPSVFGDRRFDLIISWSVFTHLPIDLAKKWFADFARVMRPGALLFVTAWGSRFFEVLAREEQKLRAGKEIHWFHKQVIEQAGDLAALKARHAAGEVVFIPSTDPNYGDVFMSSRAARALAIKGLEFVAYDDRSLAQDLLVYRLKG